MYNNFEYEEIDIKCKKRMKELKDFLLQFDLKIDLVDYSIVVRDNNKIVATISKYANLVKCSAICQQYSGQNILNTLMTKVFLKITSEGYQNAFLITKVDNKNKFQELGLYEVYSNDKIIYFTNNINRLNSYIDYLKKIANKNINKNSSVIVMNANPFTIGHKYLIDQARNESEILYVIPVLEDASFFTYEERKKMIKDYCDNFENIKVIEGSEYLISKSSFPSYFLNNDEEVVREQAKLDVGLFYKIYQQNLNIKKRFVGTEPISKTTNIYNEIMKEYLASKNINLIEVERIKINEMIVSASLVREAILESNYDLIRTLSPKNEHDFLMSDKIKQRAEKNKKMIYKEN